MNNTIARLLTLSIIGVWTAFSAYIITTAPYPSHAPLPAPRDPPTATPLTVPEDYNPASVWTPQVLSLCEPTPVRGRPDLLATPIYTLPRRSYIVPREWTPGWFMIQPAHWIPDNTICHPDSVDWHSLKRSQ